ncbi:MAG: hypothetical protein ACSLFQ_05325 [Thermoanaerobaculia bacterium]
MRKRRLLLFVLIATVSALPMWADHFADFYVLPVASHVSGVGSSMWMTDTSIQNFSSSPLNLQFLFIESGEGNSENVSNLVSTALPDGSLTIAPGGSVVIKDILAGYTGSNGGSLGAVMVTGNRAFAVTSRAYVNAASGGTYGQTVPPVRDFIDNTIGDTNNALSVAYVPGLIHNAAYRTNLGFVAGAGLTGMVIEIRVKAADGSTTGTRTFSIPANQFVHIQFAASTLAPALIDAGAAEFRITGGDGAVAPYASVIDNVSQDAVFIPSIFPPNAAFTKVAPSDSLFRRLAASYLRH